MSDQSGEQCSTPTLSWDYTEHRFQIFYLWLSWTIFFKLSYNVMSYPLLKNYYRKSPMKYSSACYYVITEDSVQCYFSSRNQCKPLSMWYLPICPDASTLPLQKEKILLCWEKATGSTSVNTRGVGGKGAAKKGKFTANAKLSAAAELKIRDVPCTPMRGS